MATAQLGTELAQADISAITAFLNGQTGEQPQVAHPVLPPRIDETPLPNPSELPLDASR